MKLLFIRHGETDWNKNRKIQGSQDIQLNETGLTQAKILADKITQYVTNNTGYFTSYQKRACQTAEEIGKKLSTTINILKGIHEVDFGLWEGLTLKEIESLYPNEFDEWSNNRRYTRPPQGESYQDMLERVNQALLYVSKSDLDTAVIITHGGVIMSLQCLINNTPFENMKIHKPQNAEIIEIDSELILERLI